MLDSGGRDAHTSRREGSCVFVIVGGRLETKVGFRALWGAEIIWAHRRLRASSRAVNPFSTVAQIHERWLGKVPRAVFCRGALHGVRERASPCEALVRSSEQVGQWGKDRTPG
jgi:hypothetical protein